jgi:hypothetical protein
MPYKRLSWIVWTFSIHGFVLIFRDVEFFNTHSQYGVTGADALTVG